MDYKIIRILEDAFEDSDLPYTVDIIDMNTINHKFKQIVSKQMIPLSIGNNANNTTDQWRKIQFGNCAELIRDTTSPINLADTPYVGLEHIGEGTLSLIGCGTAKDVTSAKTYFRSGDILFGKLRPYFRKVIHVDFNGICSTDIWVIRPTKGINADFLFYIVASMEFVNFAMQGSIGTKMPRAKWEWVSRYNVNIPHVSKQQNIANILKILDNKIKLNKRMRQTLEEISRALLKLWFVDFEPIRAKMDGRWKHGKSLPGLPAHLYDLFPDNLTDSKFGEIPEGWTIKDLTYYSTLNPESWSRTKAPKVIEYVDLSNTKFGTIHSTQHYIWNDAPSRAQRVLRLGDTIIGTVRPGNNSYALVGRNRLTGSTGFAVLRPRHDRYREFVYLASTNSQNIKRLAHHADGAAYPAVSPEIIMNTSVASSNDNVLDQFSYMVSPLINKILKMDTEAHILSNLRDVLLPKLMSGELQLPLSTHRSKK